VFFAEHFLTLHHSFLKHMANDTVRENRKALYHTFGCKLNFAETSSLSKRLEALGISRVANEEVPDVIVINSCSVTELADKKCRQTIRSLSRKYPDAGIVVTGCYAQLKPKEVAALRNVVIVAGADQKGELPEMIVRWIDDSQKVTNVSRLNEIRKFVPSCSRGDRTRYFLKVQDGCNYYCSYCTIPMARGRSRSGEIAEIVEQARQAAREGGKEIVITGVNIGDFGYGRDDTFFDLIRRLDEVEGIERYRISSIEPNLLTDEMIEWVAGSRAFMPHFHLPLQSGDNDVLRLMRRRYDTDLYRHRVETIRKFIPDAFIGVDLITGARGETRERFENSRRFVESLAVSRLHVFPYSERPGTRALTDIDHVVSQEEKHIRCHEMLQVSERKLNDFTSRFIGTVRPVLIEHTLHSDGTLSGFTDNYLKVRIKADISLSNTVVEARLTEIAGDEVIATLI